MSKEEPKRLTPTKETVRQLFALSGNLCAFPGCTQILIDPKGVFVGQVAHIEAAEPGGERFNPKMTNQQRRHPSNLVILCYPHHKETNDVDTWTVEKLKKVKAEHERRFQNPEKAILAGLKDWTQSDQLVLPKNLDGLHKALDSPFLQEGNEEECSKYFSLVCTYLEKYKNVPHETRLFLGAVVERMVIMDGNGLTEFGSYSTTVPLEDFRAALQMPHARLKRSCEALELYGLGGIGEDSSGYTLKIRNIDGVPFWYELALYSQKMGQHFRTYYMDLDFSGLEG